MFFRTLIKHVFFKVPSFLHTTLYITNTHRARAEIFQSAAGVIPGTLGFHFHMCLLADVLTKFPTAIPLLLID